MKAQKTRTARWYAWECPTCKFTHSKFGVPPKKCKKRAKRAEKAKKR